MVVGGKAFMRTRKPVNVKAFSIAHNFVMFWLSLYMVVETWTQVRRGEARLPWERGEGERRGGRPTATRAHVAAPPATSLPAAPHAQHSLPHLSPFQAYHTFGWAHSFRPWGNVAEPGARFSPSGRRLARVIWVHYLSKVYEFTDTAIMILKKNERQISFLHVYHHASTFFPCWWAAINFAPGGDVWFICALNSAVHVFMYAYYLFASTGISIPAGVKKSITTVQMVQFGLLNAQALYGTFWATYYRPRVVVVLALIQSVVFMALFYNFYRQAYAAKARAAREAGGAKKPATRASAKKRA